MQSYVHGYSHKEQQRLITQAETLTDLLHRDTQYPAGSTILEAGCGVGAQTATLCKKSPNALFTAVDISQHSLDQAIERCRMYHNVTFHQSDICNHSFPNASFDHLFLCFVLEHLPTPANTLRELLKVVKPGGTVTIIEGDHGSPLLYPDSVAARAVIQCQIILQERKGGNCRLGSALYPLMTTAGVRNVTVSPRLVYSDKSQPESVQDFVKDTFISMVTAVKEEALDQQFITIKQWDQGVSDLYKAAEEGSFCYTFFKALGRV